MEFVTCIASIFPKHVHIFNFFLMNAIYKMELNKQQKSYETLYIS